MVKNIFLELKNAISRKYTVIYVLCIAALIVIANVAVMAFRAIYGANEGTYAYNLIEYATWCFVIPYYTCIFIADIVMSGVSLKGKKTSQNDNGVSNYLSKFVASLLLGVIFVVIAVIALLAITSLFQIKDEPVDLISISDFLEKMFIACPLWFAGVAFGSMFLVMFARKRNAIISFFVLTLVIPRIIMIFAAEPFSIPIFRFIRTYTITQNFYLIPYPADPARNVGLTVALGIIYGVIATVIGCICYSKKTSFGSDSK